MSSTFRDMQEEREELAKRVFPQLCKLCKQRSVTWSEKDKGDLDGAMKLHKEEEHLCRELGDKDGLAISLISQALFLKKLYEENLRKYGEL
ncbi:MAG: hypothetical protein COS95_04645 [Ignavibacteriales bacterium CG07_land_8_20_14_0_80_59_12]|nr:MAG: hypothetical protein COS95_04645 [Ignavibacteriales bacterium CG07_land_8_20_14_0_80_59_12]